MSDPSKSLYQRACTRFDELVETGELLYGPSTPEVFTNNGFTFNLRLTPALLPKPLSAILAPPDARPANPFLPPDPSFVVHRTTTHNILLNKFCPLRPMFVLSTIDYAPQEDDLSRPDIDALWTTLTDLEDSPGGSGRGTLLGTYACGATAGASQPHKHMQIFPKDAHPGFTLFPDTVLEKLPLAAGPNWTSIPGVPFQHLLTRIPADAGPGVVYSVYTALLPAAKEIAGGVGAYNFLLSREWVMLVPRRRRKVGESGSNAAGMVGLVWCKDENEARAWRENGGDIVKYLGVPVDGSKVAVGEDGEMN